MKYWNKSKFLNAAFNWEKNHLLMEIVKFITFPKAKPLQNYKHSSVSGYNINSDIKFWNFVFML